MNNCDNCRNKTISKVVTLQCYYTDISPYILCRCNIEIFIKCNFHLIIIVNVNLWMYVKLHINFNKDYRHFQMSIYYTIIVISLVSSGNSHVWLPLNVCYALQCVTFIHNLPYLLNPLPNHKILIEKAAFHILFLLCISFFMTKTFNSFKHLWLIFVCFSVVIHSIKRRF